MSLLRPIFLTREKIIYVERTLQITGILRQSGLLNPLENAAKVSIIYRRDQHSGKNLEQGDEGR